MRSLRTLCCLCSAVVFVFATTSQADDGRPADARARDSQPQRIQNSFSGPTGGIRVIDASSGPKGTFRLALNTEFFLIRDYFVPSDRAQHFAGNLSLSVSATDFLEVFASAEVTSAWDNSTNPSLVQRVADILIGIKGYHWLRPWVAIGADLSLGFPGGVGDMKETFRATSVGLRANANFDLREHARDVPLIARINAQYWFDNSSKLVGSIQTGAALTPFERFAYGINEVDTVRIGAGLEVPLDAGNVGIHPMLDWRWDVPVNRQSFDCNSASVPPGDGCLSDVGVKAYPMTLTIGLRLYTPPPGLAFTIAADVGLTGTKDFVRELAPNSPYNIVVGVAYAIDARRRKAQAPTVRHVTSEPEATGRVYGLVVSSDTEQPIEDALVTVRGDQASPQASDESGRFVTFVVPFGDVALDVTHPQYRPAECMASFAEEDPYESEAMAEVVCTMTPTDTKGSLRIRVVGKKGRPIPALEVVVRGPSEHRLVSDDAGSAAIDLVGGRYTAYIDDPAYLVVVTDVEVTPREETLLTLKVLRKPSRPRVVVKARRIVLRSQVSFATGSNEILPNSEPLLLEVADVLLRDPSLELIEIQGHTDNRGDRELNMKLSQSRAEAVRDWLVAHGVEPARLMAKGYGPTHPIVPNITAHNRARNRRVQFSIVRRAGASVAAKP